MSTIGVTRFSTYKIIEQAIRRCGVSPASLTTEIMESAKINMFMFLVSLADEGINMWCIDRKYVTLVQGKATHALPAGTLDILDVIHCSPTIVTTGSVSWFGVKYSTLPAGDTFDFEGSDDAFVTPVVIGSFAKPTTVNEFQWYRVDPTVEYTSYRVQGADEVVLASAISEKSLSPLARTDYANLPNKAKQSANPTSYWYEKLVDPQLTIWPTADNQNSFLTVYRHRQTSDIDTLPENVDIPTRWYEPLTWQLGVRLAFELPNVAESRIALLTGMAEKHTITVGQGETDHGPVRFAPNITGYTR